METPVGPVPQAATRPSLKDRLQTVMARVGTIRNTYTVPPGLYAVGRPTENSPVLVSANYKLSFDALRFRLSNIAAWLLVIDTRGVNVWCAAGKGIFSSAEVVHSLQRYEVGRVVNRQEIIVPQLAATGVSGREVKKQSGFTVKFGPVRSADIEAFLHAECRADESMRMVSFTLKERAELIPVEFYLLAKPLLVILPLCFLVSAVGPSFSLSAMVERGLLLIITTLLALIAGGAVVPLLLPWLPGRQFWIKGIIPGLIAGFAMLQNSHVGLPGGAALVLWAVALSSYMAMNFTGSTPFTSPSGVEYEMKRGLPVQMLSTSAALTLWLIQAFI